MNKILNHNIQLFDVVKDCDYLFQKEHRLRGDVAIDMFKEIMDKKTGHQKMLSIACSIGVIEEKMKRVFDIQIYGVDAAGHTLEEAKKRGIVTTCADITERLPYQGSFFDYVFAGEIIEHILNTKYFLSELYRILKPNGYIVITTPNLARIDDRFKLLFGKTPRQTSPFHPYLYLHIRPFTYHSLKKTLELSGFTDVKLKTNVFTIEVYRKRINIYSKLLTRLFPTLGSTLIVRARKS